MYAFASLEPILLLSFFWLQAHERRFKQFKSLAAKADPKSNAQELIERDMDEKQPKPAAASGTSKRAEKKVRYLSV